MTREQLLQALQNQNLSKFLDVIAISEGTGSFSNPYLAKGGTNNELLDTGYADHPMAYGKGHWKFKLNSGQSANSTANGKYAFLHGTWKDLKKRIPGLTFAPQDQDMAATYLIHQRGALNDVLNGNFRAAIQKVGPVWASLPTAPASYNQFKHGWDKIGRAFKTVGLDPASLGLNGQYQPIKGVNTSRSVGASTMQNLGGQPPIQNNQGAYNVDTRDSVLSQQNQQTAPTGFSSAQTHNVLGADTLMNLFGNPNYKGGFWRS